MGFNLHISIRHELMKSVSQSVLDWMQFYGTPRGPRKQKEILLVESLCYLSTVSHFSVGFFYRHLSHKQHITLKVCVCVWVDGLMLRPVHVHTASQQPCSFPFLRPRNPSFPLHTYTHTHCPSHIRHSTHTGETYETSRGDMTSQFRHSYNPPALNSLLMHTHTLTRTHRKITLFRREKPYELLIGINYLGRVSYLSVSKQCRYL